ncbi:MAG: hypothetical protein IT392_12920 [Nitrospirae bacterium]|nr:hypothetical protein [Nitrospirota bacterium]
MNRASWGIVALLAVVAIIIVASYRFSTKQHMEVVEHKPPLADVPGAAFFSLDAMQSEGGKRFAHYRQRQTQQLNTTTYRLDVTLNDRKFFRLLAEAEAKSGESPDSLYKIYEERFDLEKKAVFTVMMHSPNGHLFDYDLKRFVVLRADGIEYKNADWKESNQSSEFHRRGILTFSIPSEAKGLTLILRDTSGRMPDKTLVFLPDKE